MEFKVRYSATFVINILLIILALFMSFATFLAFYFKGGVLQYFFLLWSLIAFTRYMKYRNYIRLRAKNKPALVVNNKFIYDAEKEITYYWNDITEVYEENGYLYINLENPEEYLKQIKGKFRRFFARLTVGPNSLTYKINIDMIDAAPQALLDVLDDASA